MVIRIGTWNLENLFKPPNPFAPKTEEEYQTKLDTLASAITRMDPDVSSVQEVGDPESPANNFMMRSAVRSKSNATGCTWF
jgi:predicted extracellular nuclease